MADHSTFIGPFCVESSGNLGGSWHLELWERCRERALSLAKRASEEDRGERVYRVFDAATEYTLTHFRGGFAIYKERGWN